MIKHLCVEVGIHFPNSGSRVDKRFYQDMTTLAQMGKINVVIPESYLVRRSVELPVSYSRFCKSLNKIVTVTVVLLIDTKDLSVSIEAYRIDVGIINLHLDSSCSEKEWLLNAYGYLGSPKLKEAKFTRLNKVA